MRLLRLSLRNLFHMLLKCKSVSMLLQAIAWKLLSHHAYTVGHQMLPLLYYLLMVSWHSDMLSSAIENQRLEEILSILSTLLHSIPCKLQLIHNNCSVCVAVSMYASEWHIATTGFGPSSPSGFSWILVVYWPGRWIWYSDFTWWLTSPHRRGWQIVSQAKFWYSRRLKDGPFCNHCLKI